MSVSGYSHPMRRIFAQPKRRAFANDFAGTSSPKRRRAPTSKLKDQDSHLGTTDRRKAISTSRDIERNFPLANWMARMDCAFVAGFTFQAQTGNRDFDNELEKFVEWWSLPWNCDVRAKHSLSAQLYLAHRRRLFDGDVFCVRLSDGHMQWIEGDRIRNDASVPSPYQLADFTHGVKTTKAGRAQAYIVCNRDGGSGFAFERVELAKYIRHIGFFQRFDQIRGVSPFLTALNAMRDIEENVDYALAKAKVSQLAGLWHKNTSEESLGTVTASDEDGDDENDKWDLDMGEAPWNIDLDPEEEVGFLENKTPSPEFQAFMTLVTMLAMKGADMPYSFYDEGHTTYSGSRMGWNNYNTAKRQDRSDLRHFLMDQTYWRIDMALLDGDITLPAGIDRRDIKLDWQSHTIPMLDPSRETMPKVLAIRHGLTSPQRQLKSEGADFFDVADEIADASEYLESKGLSWDQFFSGNAKAKA